jgi:hypothetical protein
METKSICSVEAREIVGILMESCLYLELSLRERHCLVMHLLNAGRQQII